MIAYFLSNILANKCPNRLMFTKVSDGVSRHVLCLKTVSKTVSRHGFSRLGLGCVSTLVCLVLARVSSFHVLPCVTFRDCILTVSHSGIVKCMLWPPYGQAIIFLSCGFFFLSSIFYLFSLPILSRCTLHVYHTWCGLIANLGRRSETCCTRLAQNTRRKKSPKICHLCTIAQPCRAISSQLRRVSTIGKIC